MKRLLYGVLIGVILSAVALTIIWEVRFKQIKFYTPYQAVMLDNNQVYYGKLTDLGRDYPVLTDVYYIKSGMDPKTKDVKNVLIRRGNELHGPDRMYLNGRHILLIEPVGPLSSVAKLIAESKNQ